MKLSDTCWVCGEYFETVFERDNQELALTVAESWRKDHSHGAYERATEPVQKPVRPKKNK